MPKFTFEERSILRLALRVAAEDGSIFPTGVNEREDEKLRAKMAAKIAEIERKLDET